MAENNLETDLITGKRLTKFEKIREKYFAHNWENSDKLRLFGLRIIGITVIGIVLMFYSLASQPMLTSGECIIDQTFIATNSINLYFQENSQAKDAIVILSSLLIDLAILTFLIEHVFWAKSWHQILFLSMFYAVRANLQTINILGFPEGFIWEYPGMYSVVVTYARSSDFFYSGHVGVMLFCALDSHKKKYSFFMWYCLLCCVFEGFVMIFVRCHYGVDIVAGLAFCHYFWILSGKLTIYFDKYLGYQPWIFTKD